MQRILLAGVGLVSILALQSNTCLGQDKPSFTPDQASAALRGQTPLAPPSTNGGEASSDKCDPTKLVVGPDGNLGYCKLHTAGVVFPTGDLTAPTAADAAAHSLKSRRSIISTYHDGYNLKLTFDTGSAELSEHDKVNAQQIAQALNGGAASVHHVLIAGFTDESGTAASNEALSQHRAEAAKDYLVSLGVSADRLAAKGFGPIRGLKNDPTHRRVVARRLD
jgi:outer membrane protein OmpA-like peptidoglycan-associated protein